MKDNNIKPISKNDLKKLEEFINIIDDKKKVFNITREIIDEKIKTIDINKIKKN